VPTTVTTSSGSSCREQPLGLLPQLQVEQPHDEAQLRLELPRRQREVEVDDVALVAEHERLRAAVRQARLELGHVHVAQLDDLNVQQPQLLGIANGQPFGAVDEDGFVHRRRSGVPRAQVQVDSRERLGRRVADASPVEVTRPGLTVSQQPQALRLASRRLRRREVAMRALAHVCQFGLGQATPLAGTHAAMLAAALAGTPPGS
jgi:hypothetical protein